MNEVPGSTQSTPQIQTNKVSMESSQIQMTANVVGANEHECKRIQMNADAGAYKQA